MIKIQRKHLRTITRRFWGTVFTLIIAIAVFVQLGRQAFPLLQDYKYEIIGYFGKELGLVVEVDSLQADWSGLRPKLSLNQVLLKSRSGDTIFKINNASIELSIISSVINQRFTWRQIVFDGFETRIAQDETGRWSIPGMPEFTQDPNKPSRFSFDDPYDLFLIGRRISITDASFTLEYFNGENASIFVPDISIENDFDFRRIIASVDVGDGEQTMSLVIEGDGDPRQENFIANGYFELAKFPTKRVLKALAISDDILTAEEHRTSLRLWFQSDAAKGLVLRGDLLAEGEMELADGSFLAPRKISTEFVGTLDTDRGWDLSLKDLNVQWKDRQPPALSLRLNGDLVGLKGVAIAEVDAALWSDLALYVGLSNNKIAQKYISGINPRGLLKNVHVEVTDKENGYFLLSAIVENGQSDAIMGAPALKNIRGYLQTSMHRGRFDVDVDDGFTIDLPKVYQRPMSFDKALGQLRWTIDYESKHFYISSSLITLETEYETGKGYVHLSLPFKKDVGHQALTLALGVKNGSAIRHKVYVPKIIPDDLLAWLGRSVKGGDVKDVEAIYHGSVEKNPHVDPSLQLLGVVEKASLEFDPNWPILTDLNANFVLDNNDMNIHVSSATIIGNELQSADVSFVSDSAAGGPALAIDAALVGDAAAAMALLKNSPVKQVMGTTFDNWKISGGIKASAKLFVPIDPQSPRHSQRIAVNFVKAQAVIPDINLTLNKVAGKLYYDSDKGIYSDAIKARLWEENFSAKVSSLENDEGGQETLIAFTGSAAIDDLYKWTNRPELKFTSGKTEVDGSLFIPASNSNRPLEAVVSSDLQGVVINLPPPFAKLEDEKTHFSSRIRSYPEGDEYQFSLADTLKVALLVDPDAAVTGIFEVNEFIRRDDNYSPIPKTARFDVTGYFDNLNLEQWITVKNQYLVYETESLDNAKARDSDSADSQLRVNYDVFIANFLLGSFAIEDLSVKGQRADSVWQMDVKSDLLAGLVTVAEDERPIKMDLDYIRLEETTTDKPANEATVELAKLVADASELQKSDEEGEQATVETEVPSLAEGTTVAENVHEDETAPNSQVVTPADLAPAEVSESALAGVDLRSLVAIDFSTKEFSVGETDYGNWAFRLRPIDGGIAAYDIFAETKKMMVGEDGVGAEFIWLKDGEQQSSQFYGVLRAKNLADVFAAWEQEKLLESESARIVIDAKWPGAPDEVTLKDVEGLISLNVNRGSFTRGAGSDENGLLRLIALFNFDTIVRRLRLDFSDLTAQGYAFDSVDGKLLFRDGIIYLTEPMIVKSSSSDTQLAGTVDLIEEKLDAEMVVTLPVASNIAVATALVVGLPAALGVYVMSKMFKKQVDRASSLNISITGEWQDPKVKVKKIFDIDAAERRSKKLKDDSAVSEASTIKSPEANDLGAEGAPSPTAVPSAPAAEAAAQKDKGKRDSPPEPGATPLP